MMNILTRSPRHETFTLAMHRLGGARLAAKAASAPAISSVSLALAHAAWLFMPRSQRARHAFHFRVLKLAAVVLTTAGALVVAMQNACAETAPAPSGQTAALVPLDSAADTRTLLTATATLPESPATVPVAANATTVLATDGVLSSEESPPVPQQVYTEADSSAAPQSDPAHIPRRPVIGEATVKLLALQREQTGPARPISGTEAALSYARYLKSFEYPIPEKYESNVKDIKSSRGR